MCLSCAFVYLKRVFVDNDATLIYLVPNGYSRRWCNGQNKHVAIFKLFSGFTAYVTIINSKWVFNHYLIIIHKYVAFSRSTSHYIQTKRTTSYIRNTVHHFQFKLNIFTKIFEIF